LLSKLKNVTMKGRPSQVYSRAPFYGRFPGESTVTKGGRWKGPKEVCALPPPSLVAKLQQELFMSIVLFVLHNGPADLLAIYLVLRCSLSPSFVVTSLFLLNYDEG
jgi:hypothetical protein